MTFVCVAFWARGTEVEKKARLESKIGDFERFSAAKRGIEIQKNCFKFST